MTEKEFNEKIWPLAGPVYNFAVHLTGDGDTGADVAQEVMTRLWENRGKLEKIREPKAWALKITRNLCLDILKKRKPVYDEKAMLQREGYACDAVREIETRDTAGLVRKIIATLPGNQREVIVLREIEGLEYAEIAEITGLGLDNIRVLLSRARTKVKDILIRKYNISDER